MATMQIPVRTLPAIFYEDPEPVEDGMQQAIPLIGIVSLLIRRYADRPDVYVGGGGFVMYDEKDGNKRIAPDCYIAFDVDVERIEEMPNYLAWQVGKVPDFVLEMASKSTAANDMGWKRDLYAQLEIPEYWRLDRTGGEMYGQPITGERLVDGKYEPYEVHAEADGSATCYSPVLDLIFIWSERGGFDLLDPLTRRTIDEVALERGARLVAEALVDTERTARQSAETRADTAEARAETAEAQLRALQEENERLRGQR